MKQVGARWSNHVLICSKCSKRIGGGFGPKGTTRLAKALRRHLGEKKGRKATLGIVEVKCLGVCPRDAVTVINGAQDDAWLLVPAGTDMDEVAREIGLIEPAAEPG